MKNPLLLLTILFFCAFSSCQKEYLDQNGGSPVYDANAKKFFDSSGVTDPLQKIAIDNFSQAQVNQKIINIYRQYV